MINFPDAPTLNQVFRSGSQAWYWDSIKWVPTTSPPIVLISDTPPVSPYIGMLWFDSVGGNMYLRFDDSTSVQWIPTTNQLPDNPGSPITIANGGTSATTGPTALTNLGAVAKIGDTMSGELRITSPGSGSYLGSPSLLTITAPDGSPWCMVFKNTTYSATNLAGIWVANDGGFGFSASTSATSNSLTIRPPSAATSRGLTISPQGGLYFGEESLYADPGANNITARGMISGSGIQIRPGTAGPGGGSVFNINWTGLAYLWVDTTNVGQITLTSDYRVKENVSDLPSMWDRVKALRPISYTIKDNPELMSVADPAEQWGFIAHELQETLLESAATGYKDAPNIIQSPSVMALLAPLTKALQEAMARIEALENKL